MYGILNVTQEVLRAIAKMSNFNVDVQAKHTIVGIMCRAICSQCKAEIPIEVNVIRTGQSLDGEFEKFCKEHRHDQVVEVAEIVGRKFRC